MTIYSEEQAKAILDKAIKFSKADECSATLSGSSGGNVRYAPRPWLTSWVRKRFDSTVKFRFSRANSYCRGREGTGRFSINQS